jgi:hypothetical protein
MPVKSMHSFYFQNFLKVLHPILQFPIREPVVQMSVTFVRAFISINTNRVTEVLGERCTIGRSATRGKKGQNTAGTCKL